MSSVLHQRYVDERKENQIMKENNTLFNETADCHGLKDFVPKLNTQQFGVLFDETTFRG